MHKHEKLTKREVVIIGATVVTACIAGYFGYKYFNEVKQIEKLTEDARQLAERKMSLEDSIDVLKAAFEETGRI